MKKNRGNSGYIGSDQRTTRNGLVDFDKYYLERKIGRFEPILSFTGLLSVYPGAAAAYSLRLLDNFYQGYAIKVRRASDNAEQDISFINNELDKTTLETFCSGTDGFVTTWYDQSGNGYDTTQTTSANQPQIVSSGSTILENGKPCVQFDGSDDYFSIPSSKATFKFLHDGTTSTVFSTVRIGLGSAVNDVAYIIFCSSAASAEVGSFFSYEDRTITSASDALRFTSTYGVGGNVTVNSIVNNIFAPNEQSLIYGLIDTDNATANQRFRGAINGASDSGNNTDTNNPVTTDASNDMQIGRYLTTSGGTGSYFLGRMQELIFYPSDQSSSRTGIETNINNYYNIF